MKENLLNNILVYINFIFSPFFRIHLFVLIKNDVVFGGRLSLDDFITVRLLQKMSFFINKEKKLIQK